MRPPLAWMLPVAAALGGLLAGPGVRGTPDRPLIGLSLDTLKEERWQQDRDTFVARAEALGARVIVQSANSDDTRQVGDVEALISRGVDLLVIVPHNGAAMTRAVRAANEAKIPVLSYDRLILNCRVDYYLSFDNVKVGEAQARYLTSDLLSVFPGRVRPDAPPPRSAANPVRIVRIYGAPTDNNAKMFKQGQDNVLNPLIQAGQVQVVFEDWALDWRPDVAKKIMNAAIAKVGHNFDAVLVTNDGTAGGAIQALKEEGLAGKVLVTGQDADVAACQRILHGTQAMTVYKPVRKLANLAAETAVALIQGRPVQPTSSVDNGARQVPALFVDVITVNKDNLLSTVVADGFHRADEVQ
jgi:D-xylose transport system substrate-binding protein